MVPKHGFLKQINSCLIATVPEIFYEKVEEGSIMLKKSSSFSFCEKGISVDGEANVLNTELIILATGFRGDKKLQDIFVSPDFAEKIVGSRNSAVPLYRLVSFLQRENYEHSWKEKT